jgi:diguanylate cyclase (GGDEF)-like protein/putative nucleotidyltransferase with HDIG domain
VDEVNQERRAIRGAAQRAQMGRLIGILMFVGVAFSIPLKLLLSDPPLNADAFWLADALALALGVLGVALPWRRMPAWTSHLITPVATAEIALSAAIAGSHASVFASYFVLCGFFVGYSFDRRAHVVAHMGFVLAAMAGVAVLTAGDDPDALLRTMVFGPCLAISAGVIHWLSNGMRASQRELRELAESRRREARTDQLTGLGNRRKLLDDLEVAMRPGREGATLAVFDLDGFKPYNDQFGHPAGDGLLNRLGHRLADALHGRGDAYRLGGDEFCVLIPRVGLEAQPLLAAASAALTEKGESFEIGASHGTCELGTEATTPSGALQLADKRLYADKHRRRASAGQQASDVLLTLLATRKPDLSEHVQQVASLARHTARRLGLDEEEIDVTVRAAELHDIGKAAIPDAILEKPGPLDDNEREFVQRHVVVGEHILNAAQALRPVGRIVRSSHERWDGTGYPDGLTGAAIPLASRIIAVCDAFEAMLSSERRYRRAYDPRQAIAELRAGAGTQFDPDVVEAFVAEAERYVGGPGTLSLPESPSPSPSPSPTEQADSPRPAPRSSSAR